MNTGDPSEKGKQPGDAFSILILVVVTLACLVPFLGKAFHIDDPLFIWCGRHVTSDPWNFYNFKVNWFGKMEPMSLVMRNPPLASYYLALSGSIFGWSETALHAGFLLPALAAVLGTYRLAKRFCAHPLAAALVTISAPVFLLSSTSVMCDTMMLALWVWSLIFWTEGLAQYSRLKLALAAILIATCGLTKFFGFALIPLVVAYSFAERRKMGSWLVYMLVPLAVMVSFELLTRKLYGRGALLDGLNFVNSQWSGGDSLSQKIVTELSFTGGSIIILLLSAPLLWGRRALLAGIAALLVFALALIAQKKFGHAQIVEAGQFKWLFLLQFTLFVAAGVVLLLLAAADPLRRRTPDGMLLLLWIAGTLVYTLVAYWQISGRYVLPLLPAAAILLVRRLEIRKSLHVGNQLGPLWAPLGISLAIALMVTWSDFKLANSSRVAAAHLKQEAGACPTVWFEGHWGFQYYMEEQGARAIDFWHFHPKTGDAVILPLGNSYVFNPPAPELVSPWFNYERDTSKYLSTMCSSTGAGFYADDWGPMPYAFGHVPPQQYAVFRAR